MLRVAPPGSFNAVTVYRLVVFGRAHGPWRRDRRIAQRDALAAGLGEFDEQGRFFVMVPADIVSVRLIDEGGSLPLA